MHSTSLISDILVLTSSALSFLNDLGFVCLTLSVFFCLYYHDYGRCKQTDCVRNTVHCNANMMTIKEMRVSPLPYVWPALQIHYQKHPGERLAEVQLVNAGMARPCRTRRVSGLQIPTN